MNATEASDATRWVVVASRFNATVVERLLDGAVSCLREGGVAEAAIDVVRVAGAFEVAQAAARACGLGGRPPRAGLPRGLVALAAVVRGQTPHFDHLCAATTGALMDVAVGSGVPLGFGVLTCDDLSQALARSGGEAGHAGRDAAAAALDLARVFDGLDGRGGAPWA